MSIAVQNLEPYQDFLAPQYQNFPRGNYVNILMIRETLSETIFRTEGAAGPGLNKEFVRLTAGGEPVPRVVITKRKQVAVERRTGRELLRRFDMLYSANQKGGEENICALNRNNPCEKCIDCMLYGYAVGGGGAQRSRVITQDAYSLLPAGDITEQRTFNATYDDGTMRDPINKEPSRALSENEYVKPHAHFLDVQVLKDVMAEELVYVLGNLLRSTRYGAVSSRVGRVTNHIIGITFSTCELYSNLELTEEVAGLLPEEPELPLLTQDLVPPVRETASRLAGQACGRVQEMPPEEFDQLVAEVRQLYRQEEGLQALLRQLEGKYPDRR